MHLRSPSDFRDDRRGAILVMTAIMLTALVSAVALAYETGRGFLIQAALARAAEMTAISAAKEFDSAQRDSRAATVFAANFSDGLYGSHSPAMTLTADGVTRVVTISTSAAFDPLIFGLGSVTVRAKAAAQNTAGTVTVVPAN